MIQSTVLRIVVIASCRLVLNTARRFVYPFAPVIAREFSVPLTSITSIIAISQFISLLGVFSGPLADSLGNKRLMKTGLLMLCLGMLLCAVSTSYIPLAIGLLVASLGKIFFDPAIQAYIGHTVPYISRTRVIGLIEISWAGSTLVGIPALAMVIEHQGITSAFVLLAVLGGVALVAVNWVIVEESMPDSPGHGRVKFLLVMRQVMGNRAAIALLLFGFCVSVANDALFVAYGLWFQKDFGATLLMLGFSTVSIGMAELLGESFSALFAGYLGVRRTVLVGLVFSAVAYILLPLLGFSLYFAMAGLFFVFLFFECTIVTSFSLSTEILPASRATMMAGFYGVAGIGRMIGVMLGAWLWQLGGIWTCVLLSSVMTLLGLVAILHGLAGWNPEQVAD